MFLNALGSLHPSVSFECAGVAKGCITVFETADKGLLTRVCPDVSLQVAGIAAGVVAALEAADEGFLTQMARVDKGQVAALEAAYGRSSVSPEVILQVAR
jgi:hypothetical protein